MADDRSGKLGTGAQSPNPLGRPPRSPVTVPVRCRFPSIIDFVETQSVNISREGMYLRCDSLPDVGSTIEFQVSLDDGFVILQGTASVVRVVTAGDRGMGVRFLDVDESSRRLINRIVEVNVEEGKNPTVPFDFTLPAPPGPPPSPRLSSSSSSSSAPSSAPAPSAGAPPPSRPARTMTGAVPVAPMPAVSSAPVTTAVAKAIQFNDGKLRVVLSPATATFFSYNPLLNIRMGGFFIPVEEEVPLGTTYKVEIVDLQNVVLLAGKGKVVARQELRIGIRISDADKDALGRLQALVAKLSPSK
jgi:uncharacterized protein (TIGR02266 family)